MASFNNERIKYYPHNYINYFQNKERVLKKNISKFIDNDLYKFGNINDLIELINVLKYLKEFNADDASIFSCNIENLEKKINKASGTYFHNIKNETEFKEIIKSIEDQYRDDLISVFSRFSNVIKKFLTEDVIFFLCENSYLQFILDNKNFLNQHSSALKSFLFLHLEFFHFYLSKELVNSNAPFNFTSEEFNSLVDKYINLAQDKIDLMSLCKIYENPLLSRENKYNVSQFRDQIKKKIIYNTSKIEVKFTEQSEISKSDKILDEIITYSYDATWLSKYLDNSTILNNFKYIFNFLDKHHRISFISAPYFTKRTLFKFIVSSKKKEHIFDSNIQWNYVFSIYILKTACYSDFLCHYNIFLENVIDWFFSDYIKNEFSIDNFVVNLKNIKNVESFLDKIKILIPEFEGIFKQFESYSEFGYVNHGYISNVLNDGENAYPESLKTSKITYVEKSNSDDAKIIFNDLFSDGFRLKDYKNLFDFLIKNKNGFDSKLLSELYPSFNLLLKNNILIQNSRGDLFVDTLKLSLLKEVEDYGYLCLNFLEEDAQSKVKNLINDNLLTSYNSFMSKQENDLFNFVFNNKFSNNPLGLRNLYLHGNPSLDMAEHEFNYFISLTMMIVLVLKLNDAFTIMTSKDQGKRRFNNVFEDENSIILT